MNIQSQIPMSGAEQSLLDQLEKTDATGAIERIKRWGLPTRRVEAYHYTDLKMLLNAIPPVPHGKVEGGAPVLRIAGAYRIIIANGHIENTTTAPAGIAVGRSNGSPLAARDDVLVEVNSALAGETLELELTGSVDPVVHIDRRMEGTAAHVQSGAKIAIAAGAKVTIIETVSGSDAAHVGNAASVVTLGEGAEATHIMVDLSAGQAVHFATLEYQLGAKANLTSIAINAGANLARTQIFASVAGEGAHADFLGLNLVDTGQHRDITLDVSHEVANTTSTELYKQIARGRGKAVFQGKITVAQDAQKTDAKMMTQGLMLSDEAEILSKPELVIYADDVVCGHGATCGDLDDTSMFYLMSRGIARADAEVILIRAFLAEITDAVEDEYVAEALTGVIEGWLSKDA